MFDRFTDAARETMAQSRTVALKYGHGVISNEHIFLGMMKVREARARRVLQALGLEVESLVASVEDRMKPGDDTSGVISQIPFRPKRQVVKGVFMAGDSAGVMPPFLGIGVTAALRSGWACGEVTGRWIRGELDFDGARGIYETWWRHGFQKSQKWGNVASRLLCRRSVGSAVVGALNLFPGLGDFYYRRTRILMPALGLRDGPALARGTTLDSR